VRMLYADSFPRDIYRCFQENRVLGSALDVGRVRGQALKTCPVQIFGQTREYLTGTLQVALRCGATICQAFVVSRPNFYFRLIVKPPLQVQSAPDHAEHPELVARLMQMYADGIAAHVANTRITSAGCETGLGLRFRVCSYRALLARVRIEAGEPITTPATHTETYIVA